MSPRWTLVIDTTTCLCLSVHILIVPEQHEEWECGGERVKEIPLAMPLGELYSYAVAIRDGRPVRKHRPVVEEHRLSLPTNPAVQINF